MALAPEIGAAGVMAGGDMLTSLANSIFNTRDTGRLKRLAEYLRSRMGRDVLPGGEQELMVQRNMAAMAPQLNQQAESIAKRSNLDSGVAQGALMDRIFPSQMAMRNDLAMKNIELSQGNDARIQALLAQIESAIAG